MLLRVSALATALVLLLAGCSQEGDGADRQPAGKQEPAVQALEIAWQVPTDHAFTESDDGRGDGLWTTSEQVTVVSDTAVTTYDLATGEKQAQIALPGHVCAVSADVNAGGVGVVVVGRQSDGVHVDRCQSVVAVDTVAGKVRWRARVRETAYLNNVSVGEQAVAVTDVADGARRLRVRDGHRLPALGSGPSTSNGVTVVAPNADDTALQVFDQDSGRLLRTLPIDDLYDAEAILPGTDPVVVAANDADGFFFRDLSGARPRPVGRQMNTSFPRFGRAVTIDGTTVLQYGGAPVVDRWDPKAGQLEPLTTLDPAEVLVGAHDDRLITLAYDGNVVAPGAVVRAVDPADPADPLVLGTIERSTGAALGLTGPLAVVGDLLLAETDEGLTAFRIPGDGVATSDLVAVSEGTITSQRTADLCRGLPQTTLDLIGYRGPGAPVDCQYYVRAADDRNYLRLGIAAFALQGEGDLSAVEQAEATFANTAEGDADQPVLDPLSGLGEDAAMDARARTLLVRQGNVVLHLRMTGSAQGVAARRSALTALAGDLLAELARRTGR